jgi:hypothetical protein
MEIAEDKVIKITPPIIFSFAALVFGGAAWMTAIEVNARNTNEVLIEHKVELDEIREDLKAQLKDINLKLEAIQSIDRRLYRIEVKLEEK